MTKITHSEMNRPKLSSKLNRRELFREGMIGLAVAGATSWTLSASAAVTAETPDAHDYVSFLEESTQINIQPAKRWAPTNKDILGPFYLTGAPFRGKVTPPLEPGKLLVIRGRVWGFDTKKPIAGAILDVWQADAKGSYDLTDPRNPPKRNKFKNRIRLMTDETGSYEYETIHPAAYSIGNDRYRPSHIHYMLQVKGYKKLITQLYFHGDKHLKADPWASKSNLIMKTKKVKTNGGRYDLGQFDIVLAKS